MVTLPPAIERGRLDGSVSDQATQPLVLVVDDDPDIRFLIAHVIERRGCRVLQASDASTALALCDPKELDLALVDLGLPGMDGLDLLCAINERLIDQHVPVILVTARSLASDVATGLGLGASDYLRKPFEVPELLARVDAALRIKRLQDELRRQNGELDRLVRTDALTGAFNRRHLDDAVASACLTARRQGEHVAVLVIDIDHFKLVNDCYGHETGDEVLRTVVQRLQGGVRAGDTLGRWGGDEFVIVLPRTDHRGATALGKRLCAAVAADPVVTNSGQSLGVTITVGVASGRGPDPAELIARADHRLYEAKTRGRDRVGG